MGAGGPVRARLDGGAGRLASSQADEGPQASTLSAPKIMATVRRLWFCGVIGCIRMGLEGEGAAGAFASVQWG